MHAVHMQTCAKVRQKVQAIQISLNGGTVKTTIIKTVKKTVIRLITSCKSFFTVETCTYTKVCW